MIDEPNDDESPKCTVRSSPVAAPPDAANPPPAGLSPGNDAVHAPGSVAPRLIADPARLAAICACRVRSDVTSTVWHSSMCAFCVCYPLV